MVKNQCIYMMVLTQWGSGHSGVVFLFSEASGVVGDNSCSFFFLFSFIILFFQLRRTAGFIFFRRSGGGWWT